MRKTTDFQRRLDCQAVLDVRLNLECRDEMIPILRSLQHVYSQPTVRDEILRLVAHDVNPESRSDRGREGLDYWQILVLTAARLGCGLNYDKLQDLAENHRALRQVMGIGEWDQDTSLNWRRIRDNVCLLRPQTIERISHCVVAEGHRLCPEAAEHVRADSFVMETNIHYPAESTLIRDGVRQIVKVGVLLAGLVGASGWRQAKHLERNVRQCSRRIERIAARKGPNYEDRLKVEYRQLLKSAARITRRANDLHAKITAGANAERLGSQAQRLKHFLKLTEQVQGTARRRVLEGETVPNAEKLFSLYETHTQLYKRGKAGEPMQFGRLVLVYEDAAGFIVHHHLVPRDVQDKDVVVAQTKLLKERLGERLKSLSLDRGFHSPENQRELATLMPTLCLPKPGSKQAKAQAEKASAEFRAARQRHPGVESAIGALQAGNGLERCSDRSEPGFERYLGIGVLGRNLHVLGKLLIARESAESQSAFSKRKSAA